jgi:CBS domain-containing protein
LFLLIHVESRELVESAGGITPGGISLKAMEVKDLLVPLSEYATVAQEATLYDAILALEEAQAEFDQSHYRHRAILVFDEQDRVIGKLGLFDILMALESKYNEIGDLAKLSGLGLSPTFVKSIFRNYSFWSEPLESICRNAAEQKVKDIMHILTEREYIEETAPLDEAIHQLIMGHHQSLIVTRGEEIIGIVKLSDIFGEICQMIKASQG